MDHTIEGKKFCITGKLSVYDRDGAEAAIVDAGGLIAKSVGPRTDFLVTGSRPGVKLARAKSLGIPVIDEADLESFLAGEVVDVDEESSTYGDASARDLIGEARAALDGRPSSRMWNRIIDVADSCAPEQLEMLIDFLEPQVARWNTTPAQKWTPSSGSKSAEGAPEGWLEAIPTGELRVAPHHWIVEMITRHESPKYRLVHAIHVNGLKVSGGAAVKILEREDLTNLRRLDLGESKLSATFWKKLRTLPSTTTLEYINFTALDEKSVAGVRGPHHLHALRELSFKAQTKYRSRDVLRSLIETELARSAPVFTVNGPLVEGLVEAMADEAVMPDLEALGVIGYVGQQVRQVLESDAARRVGHVNVAFNLWFYGFIESSDAKLDALILNRLEDWTEGVTAGPEHLDMSGISINHSLQEPSSLKLSREALARAVDLWNLPPSTKTMKFGKWYSKDLEERLALRGVAATR